jgi:hypothetical protein
MSSQTSHPSTHAKDFWIVQTIFGASLFFLAAFWALMVFIGPPNQEEPRQRCYAHQAQVQEAFRIHCKQTGTEFSALLVQGKQGAKLSPLIEKLRESGLLPSPPPSTAECRSWKDYMVLDLLHPAPEKISCKMHGIPPRKAPSK